MSAIEKGLLFRPDMILALLNTKPDVWPAKPIDPSRPFKWQTRRLAMCDWSYGPDAQGYLKLEDVTRFAPETGHATEAAPHPVGSLIYAKETFCPQYNAFGQETDREPFYRATHADLPTCHKWKPSIFMPKYLARLWFEVMDVRVERVNQINCEDAKAEGCYPCSLTRAYFVEPRHIPELNPSYPQRGELTQCYENLWDSINGKGSFDQGPWVWVYSLKRITHKPTP